jgi:beta-lactamase regulating signal transducer with metallopeptidase domain
MNTVFEFLLRPMQNPAFTKWFVDAAVQGILILTFAGAFCLLWRRASAAARHLIWLLAVIALPFLPMSSSLLPSWQKPLWSVTAGVDPGNRISMVLEVAPALEGAAVSGGINSSIKPSDPRGHGAGRHQIAASLSAPWWRVAILFWLLGVGTLLVRIMAGQFQLQKISRNASPVAGGEWELLLNETRQRLRLHRAVVLLRSPDNIVPLTWGWWRPKVLLPEGAEQWPEERRRVVLLHELAHVKRWDCLTHFITRFICAIYWFNPLVWIASRQMCIERERACDDLVLNGGCKASDYAMHLLEIARLFRSVRQSTAIAMARSPQLKGRITAIVDGSRRRHMSRLTLAGVVMLMGAIVSCVSSNRVSAPIGASQSESLRQQQIARLKAFSAEKQQQSLKLAAEAGEKGILPEYQRFFKAATSGDLKTVTNMYVSFKRRHPQYTKKGSDKTDEYLRTSYWGPILEICLAYDHVANCEPKYTQIAIDDMIGSIPPGGIYFGGTDPGRGIPTAFCKSHVNADPFFTITQNALADGSYLEYLKRMYGGRIYMLTTNDLQNGFQEYTTNAARRLEEKKLKPGEDVHKDAEGRVQASGQIAVMSINALLAKKIFDRNPDRQFYIEESFPLDWMYPYLEPHGLIMKINRQPLESLSEGTIQKDRAYWSKLVAGMIGDWVNDDTSTKQLAEFGVKTFNQDDFRGFGGDVKFVQDNYAPKMFSKWRSGIAGLYMWRADHAKDPEERARMLRESDFAFKQAYALCPYSPEALYRYTQLLANNGRRADAIPLAEASEKILRDGDKQAADQIHSMAEQLRKMP